MDHEDLVLATFTRYIEQVIINARFNYLHRQDYIAARECVTDCPPEPMDTFDFLERFSPTLEEVSADEALCAALAKLTQMEKTVLVLSVVADWPMAAVGRKLQISFGRAYQLRRTALAKLRRALSQ